MIMLYIAIASTICGYIVIASVIGIIYYNMKKKQRLAKEAIDDYNMRQEPPQIPSANQIPPPVSNPPSILPPISKKYL